MDKDKVLSQISDAKKNKWKTYLYGVGKLGRSLGERLFLLLDIEMNYVTDKSDLALEESCFDKEKKVKVGELVNTSNDCFVLVCVGVQYQEEIAEMLGKNAFIHYVSAYDVIKLDEVVERYWETSITRRKTPRIAVYTCITGDYDQVIKPQKLSSSCDYYLITDTPTNVPVYKVLDIGEIVPENISNPKDQNRYCKMHGFEIFPEYEYSIYLDGSIEIIGDIYEYIYSVGNSGLAMLRHPQRQCIYEEGIVVSALNKANEAETKRLLSGYAKEGMPRNYGLFECGIVVSSHNNSIGKRILEQWYKEYMKSKLRDQLVLPYVLWNEGLPSSVIGYVDNGRDVRTSEIAVKRINH